MPDSHNNRAVSGAAAEPAAAAGGVQRSWTGTGKTAVNSNSNTESSEFELTDTAHIVQRIDISTKYENR